MSPSAQLKLAGAQRVAAGMLCSMTLVEYLHYCCTGQIPANVQKLMSQGGFIADLLCALDIIGALEPLCATRPGVCDPAIDVEKDIHVPPAKLNPDGSVTPSQVRAISYCAPMNRALVVAENRITAVNLVASTQPTAQPIFKRVSLGTFGEFCLPFEPADEPGLFSNVEHVIVPPQGGFSVFLQNFNTTAEAVYHLHARMWACC